MKNLIGLLSTALKQHEMAIQREDIATAKKESWGILLTEPPVMYLYFHIPA